MNRNAAILTAILMMVACGVPPQESPIDSGETRQAADKAFVELETGEMMPLPGLVPNEAEKALMAESEAISTDNPVVPMDYTVKKGWFLVDTTQIFPITVAPNVARMQTIQAARAGGMEQALPASISFTSLLSDIMDETAGSAFEKSTWSTFALSSISGHIIDEKIMADMMIPLTSGAYGYRIVLEARVIPVKGERDPSLALDLEVNDQVLASGDELIIKVRSTTDGYLYLFDFFADNTVALLFPNKYMNDNRISADQWQEYPSKNERIRGLKYRVAAAKGVATTNETVYAVFSKRRIADLEGFINVPEGYAIFSAGDESFTTFQRWLAEIPLGQRTEKAIQIHIVNNKE